MLGDSPWGSPSTQKAEAQFADTSCLRQGELDSVQSLATGPFPPVHIEHQDNALAGS